MNELAAQLRIDPVCLRVMNEPKIDEGLGLPFSSRHLLECFELGTQKFGWSRRTPGVGSMRRAGLTLGWGMAGCSRYAARFAAEASVEIRNDGTVRVAWGTQDIDHYRRHFIGTRIGVPLSLTRTTRNFAGFVLLAFRPTTCTSCAADHFWLEADLVYRAHEADRIGRIGADDDEVRIRRRNRSDGRREVGRCRWIPRS